MRLGSGEHYGWEQSRTARLVTVLDGSVPGEFAWLQVPEGAKGGPLDVVVRPRLAGDPVWREPAPGQRVQVAAWTLSPDDAETLAVAHELDMLEPWAPPKPLPDLWLWVEG